MNVRPLIGVTIGDPAGIGPEIVARAVGNPDLHERARLLVVGGEGTMSKAVPLTGVDLVVRRLMAPTEGTYGPGVMDLLDPLDLDMANIEPGMVQGRAGQAAYGYIERAIEMALAGEIDAIATAPINKEALKAGGVPYIDHTAMLADLTGSPNPMTVFVLGNLRIFFLTRHVALREAIGQITTSSVLESLERVDGEMRRLGFENARIAVAGLNPHAGEGGLFGDEEIREIAPAVEAARARGLNVFGPVPPDSVFFQNALGKYDAVLSLYHDQGHIAAKTRDFERTVSVTVGIPFLRTSVDHGTAFDIAWKGTASAISMEEAIKVAADYAPLYRPLQTDA
jgi:4-phospho-D-threonate 3-dehydrogenase / 4-phospho-D-erythronate 3-dehydrogenase